MGNTYTPVMHSTAATLEDLTPRQAKLYLILLASPQKTMLGVMTIRLRTLAAQVGTRTDSVSKDLRTLAEIGLITLCASATHLRVIADSSAGNRWNIDLINSESSALSLQGDAGGHECDAVAEALEILSTKGNKKPSKGEKKRATKKERHVTSRHDTSDPPTSPKGSSISSKVAEIFDAYERHLVPAGASKVRRSAAGAIKRAQKAARTWPSRDWDADFAEMAQQRWLMQEKDGGVNFAWATGPKNLENWDSGGFRDREKPADKGPQKPRHVQMHEGAWFDKQGGYWRTATGYPIDQWGKPDYGAKVRFEPQATGI